MGRYRQYRFPQWKLCLIAVFLIITPSLVAARQQAFTSDGDTTYCWKTDLSVYASSLSSTTKIRTASGKDCPVQMAMDLSDSSVFVDQALTVRWEATLQTDADGDLKDNDFNLSETYTTEDRFSSETVQIVKAFVQSCDANSPCDVIQNTPELTTKPAGLRPQSGNFSTSDHAVTFSQDKVAFDQEGEYLIIAHIVLPGKDATKDRYDYAVYSSVTVNERMSTETSASSSSDSDNSDGGGLSTELISMIVVVCIVLIGVAIVGFCVISRRSDSGPDKTSHKFPEPGHVAGSRMDDEDEFAMLGNEGNPSLLRDNSLASTVRMPPPRSSAFLNSRAPNSTELNSATFYPGTSKSRDNHQTQFYLQHSTRNQPVEDSVIYGNDSSGHTYASMFDKGSSRKLSGMHNGPSRSTQSQPAYLHQHPSGSGDAWGWRSNTSGRKKNPPRSQHLYIREDEDSFSDLQASHVVVQTAPQDAESTVGDPLDLSDLMSTNRTAML